MKIKCKKTGEIFKAKENFTCSEDQWYLYNGSLYPFVPTVKGNAVECNKIRVPITQYINGYIVYSDCGGNMNKGFIKIFSPDSVEIIAG